MSTQPAPVLVQLNQRHEQLNAGEIGGYPADVAARLVKEGRGVIVEAPKVAPGPKVPASKADALRKATAARVAAQEAFDQARQALGDAVLVEVDAIADVEMAKAPRMVLVRLNRRFGSLNGRVLESNTGRVLREGEVGAFDEATAAMLTKDDNRSPIDGSLVEPWGFLVSETEAQAAALERAPDSKVVLLKLRRRVGPLNAGEIGGYDEGTAARLLANDPKHGPAAELVAGEADIVPAAGAPGQLVDPAIEVHGDRRTPEELESNDVGLRQRDNERVKAGRRQ